MLDHEKLIAPSNDKNDDCDQDSSIESTVKKIRSKIKKNHASGRDDLSGMFVNMIGKVDVRQLIIIWLTFIFIHTPAFGTYFLKRVNGACDEKDSTMTMKGIFYSSLFMLLVVVLCIMLF